MHKKVMTVMGRKVIHHSPPKHPEQGDAMAETLMKADQGLTSSTYGGMRKDMKPAQLESPKPAKTLDYLRRLIGGEKEK